MKHKDIGIIGAIVVAVLLLTVVIKTWEIKLPQAPPPSPQLAVSYVGWQDAVNKEYGYKLKMPHDWNAVQMAGAPAYPQRMQLINVKPDEMQKPHVGVVITVDPLNDQAPQAMPAVVELNQQGHEARQLKIAGETALFFDGLGDAGELFSVFVPHKEYLYQLDWTGTHPDVRKQYKDTGLKIIASLQFF